MKAYLLIIMKLTEVYKRNAFFAKYYEAHRDKMKDYFRGCGARAQKIWNAKSVLKRARRYNAKQKAQFCANMRHRYDLTEPKPSASVY